MSLDSILNALNHSSENMTTYSSQFYAEGELDFTDLSVQLVGSEPIQFPIPISQIETLLKNASVAKFGLREQTLLDKTVRDTSEISADKISVQINQQKFKQLLTQMQNLLGLSENEVLSAHLHNLLIYEPGQFFKPHQDSEKIDGMVGTLVIVLPSAHIGGDLIIQHKNQKFHFESEAIMPQSLKCVAFYADCQHEVEPVKEGYRIALTYNLVLEAGNLSPSIQNNNPALTEALKDYFSCELEDENPVSLVYLLEHSYSEHSIRWPLLKGNDRLNALALKAAADELNLIPHLALTEIRQSWQTDGDEVCPERYDLIEQEVSFSSWIDGNGNGLPYKNLYVSRDEICSAQKLENYEPDEIEAEGWMGNYGNTADYWYRRAAVVLWRKEDQVVFHFKLNAEDVLKQLIELTELPGHEEESGIILQRIHPLLWERRFESKFEFLNILNKLACYIQNPDLASTLLSKFPLKDFHPELTQNILRWQETYGVDWSVKQLRHWIEKDFFSEYGHKKDPSILENLDEIILNLINQNVDARIHVLFTQHQINAIMQNNKSIYPTTPSQEVIQTRKRVNILNQTIKACLLQQDYNGYNQLIDYALAHPESYSEIALAETVLMLKNTSISLPVTHAAYSKLKETVLTYLQEELAKGLRSAEDWSIEMASSCTCNHCSIARGFLNSPTEIERIWPLAAEGREHISRILGSLELPVDLSVIEGSRPYRLVMRKNQYLFINAEKRFKQIGQLNKEIMSAF